jgi:hypothetical protein
VINILIDFWHTFLTTVWDVVPILIVLISFQLFVIRRPLPHLKQVATGFFYVLLGLTFFLVGLEEALFPLGKLMALQLTNPEFISGKVAVAGSYEVLQWRDYYWVYIFSFSIGFSTTIAEPSLIAVALKAKEVSGGSVNPTGLRIVVALGVALGIALGVFRIVTGYDLVYFIAFSYLVVIVLSIFAPKTILALAYDSGGVTTSTVTVPLVTALGLGLSSNLPGRNPLIDGFGLIAMASVFAVIGVLFYAIVTDILYKHANSQD